MSVLMFVEIYKNLTLGCLVLVLCEYHLEQNSKNVSYILVSMRVTEARLNYFHPSKKGGKYSGGWRTYPASDTGWRMEDFRFPEINSVGGDSDKRAGTQLFFLTQIKTPILVFFVFPHTY